MCGSSQLENVVFRYLTMVARVLGNYAWAIGLVDVGVGYVAPTLFFSLSLNTVLSNDVDPQAKKKHKYNKQ